MCRILLVTSCEPFDSRALDGGVRGHVRRQSEFQGDGWGVPGASTAATAPTRHPTPIWQDHDCRPARCATCSSTPAARSGTHPLGGRAQHAVHVDDDGFAFNGELHGVTLRAAGATGAAKIFDLVRRLDHGDPAAASDGLLETHTRHIRACNRHADRRRPVVGSFTADQQPDYFTMHLARRGVMAVCSRPPPTGSTGGRCPGAVEVVT